MRPLPVALSPTVTRLVSAARAARARLARATCSALAVLAHPEASAKESYRRLAIYDAIPAEGCEALLDVWRRQVPAPPAAARAA